MPHSLLLSWAHVHQLHASNPSHRAVNHLLTFHASSSSDVHLSFRMGCTAQMNSAPTYWEIIEKCFSVQSVCMSPLFQCIKICAWTKRVTCVHFCWGSLGSYTVILRWSIVVIMAFPQLHSQSFQSVLLIQPRHAFLDK